MMVPSVTFWCRSCCCDGLSTVSTFAKLARYRRLVQRSVSCSAVKSTAALHLGWCDCLFWKKTVKSLKISQNLHTYIHLSSLQSWPLLKWLSCSALFCIFDLFWTYLNYPVPRFRSVKSAQATLWPPRRKLTSWWYGSAVPQKSAESLPISPYYLYYKTI